MRRTVVQYSALLMQDASVVPGVLGRVGYRDNIGATVLSGRDERHTHTVLTRAFARASWRPSSATLDGSRGGGWPWTTRPSPTRCRTARATQRVMRGYEVSATTSPASVGTTGAGETR
jgi:hypothetical protein